MREILLTQGKVAIVDDEDFDMINKLKWCFRADGYAGRKKKILMHRIINKTPFGILTDHINSNKLDNRKINLRNCSMSQNRFNTIAQKDNKLGKKGIHFIQNRFFVQVTGNNKRRYVGTYKSLEEAIKARNVAISERHGEFANNK